MSYGKSHIWDGSLWTTNIYSICTVVTCKIFDHAQPLHKQKDYLF